MIKQNIRMIDLASRAMNQNDKNMKHLFILNFEEKKGKTEYSPICIIFCLDFFFLRRVRSAVR